MKIYNAVEQFYTNHVINTYKATISSKHSNLRGGGGGAALGAGGGGGGGPDTAAVGLALG